nr:GH-E family nuclease [Neisseria bergeri]
MPDTATFKDVDGNKYSLRNAHMGHNPEDAVSYWNRCGRYHGAKSQAVRKWMLDPNNYRLEYGPGNCSRGAKSKEQRTKNKEQRTKNKERYKKPRKPKNGKLPKGC